jgi:hypothetical protein
MSRVIEKGLFLIKKNIPDQHNGHAKINKRAFFTQLQYSIYRKGGVFLLKASSFIVAKLH